MNTDNVVVFNPFVFNPRLSAFICGLDSFTGSSACSGEPSVRRSSRFKPGTVSYVAASNFPAQRKGRPPMRIASLSLFLASGVLLAASTPTEYRISGPYTHENLSIYLIHGKGAGKQYVTLKEAMESRKVIVYETKSVNELAVENVSGEPVFINGGDIVKGGQQDRVLTNDFVLPPKS